MAKIILQLYQRDTLQTAEFEDISRLVVGRIHSAEIRVDHPDVANVHCMIEIDQKQKTIQVIDVSGPDRGTKVNGNKVQEYTLTPKDRVQVGPVELSLYFETEKEKGKGVALQETKVFIQAPAVTEKPKPIKVEPQEAPKVPPPPKPIAEKVEEKEEAPKVAPPPPPKVPPPPKAEAKPKKKEKVKKGMPPPLTPAAEVAVGAPGEETVVTIQAPIQRTTTAAEVVEVTEMLGSNILNVITFAPGETVTLGETLDAKFTLPLEGFPNKGPFKFVESQDVGMTVHIDVEHMSGSIRTKGKLYTLKRAEQEGILKAGGPLGHQITLENQDFCKLNIGNITFFILKVPRPPRPVAAPMVDWDPVLRRVVSLVVLLWLAASLFVSFTPVDEDIVAEEAAVKVFQRILIRKEPVIKQVVMRRFNIERAPAPKRVAKKRRKPRVGGGDVGRGARRAGREGKRGKLDLPKHKKGVTAQKIQKRKVVSPVRQGLLGALTTTGLEAEITTLVTKGGKLAKPLEGVGGARLESGAGVRGEGLRGTGLGGGGEAAHIAGLGTRGRGGGAEGYGEGAVLGKGVTGILAIGDEQVIEGQLSPEEIRRVVQAHLSELRGCYQLQLSRYPELKGHTELIWVIDMDGRVSGVRTKTASWQYKKGGISLPNLERCLTSKVRTWKFPKPRGGGIVTVGKYPFDFDFK